MAKQLPIRLAFAGFFAGFSAFYYMSRNHEINRLRNLKISIDLLANVGARGLVAGVAGEVFARKLFVNYDRIT